MPRSRAPEPVPHVITTLADLKSGDCLTLLLGLPGHLKRCNSRIEVIENLDHGGRAAEIETIVDGQPWRGVFVFIGKTHPMFSEAKVFKDIGLLHAYGDCASWEGFSDVNIPSFLSNGVYALERGNFLVTDDKYFLAANGDIAEVQEVPDTLNNTASSFKRVGHAPSHIDKLLPNDILAIHDTANNTWSVHRRREHGIEPLVGARMTLSAVKKLACNVYPLTRKTRAIAVGDVFETTGHLFQITKEEGDSYDVLKIDKNDKGVEKLRLKKTTQSFHEFSEPQLLSSYGHANRIKSDFVFPQEHRIPCKMFRHGARLNLGMGYPIVMGRMTLEGNEAVVFSACGNYAIDAIKDDDNYVVWSYGAPTLIEGPVHSLEDGTLYAGTTLGSREVLFVKNKMFIRMTMTNPGLLEAANPFRFKPTKLSFDSEGRQFLTCDQQPQLAIRALAGQWYLDIPPDEQPMVLMTPMDATYSQDTADAAGKWKLRFASTATTYRAANGSRAIAIDATEDLLLPVVAGHMHSSGIPKKVYNIRNYTCPMCNTRTPYNECHSVQSPTCPTRICGGCVREHYSPCHTCRTMTQISLLRSGSCNTCHETGGVNLVHQYSYKPAPKWHGEGSLFFGTEVELEIKNHCCNQIGAAAKVHKLIGEAWYAKTDGSIHNGLEFVSHPFSLKYLLDNADKYSKLFKGLQEFMEAQSNCGIHIHTSKAGYAVKLESIPEISPAIKLDAKRLISRGLLRTQKFIYGNPKLAIHFAGRESRYANLNVPKTCKSFRDISRPASSNSSGTAGILLAANGGMKSNRYEAMNFTEKTVEFRLFRTTTDWKEYLRNVLFVDSVIQYARGHAMPKAGAPSTLLYRKFLDTNKELYGPVIEHYDAWEAKPKTMSASK